MRQTMLTTIDNPYNPFTQFDDWNAFDVEKGYYSLAYLARIATDSPDLSAIDSQIAIENAIDEIIKLNLLGLYKKIVKEYKTE